MRKWIQTIIVSMALMSCGLAMAQAYTPYYFSKLLKAHKQSPISLLFLQQAEQATFEKVSPHCYNVTFSGLKQGLMYFSDRPNRVVGKMSNTEFVGMWDKEKIYPNSVVHGAVSLAKNADEYSKVLTFANPKYLPDTDQIRYEACITDTKTETDLKYQTLYHVSLFIDNFGSIATGG